MLTKFPVAYRDFSGLADVAEIALVTLVILLKKEFIGPQRA
ncbi:MAG: hypothetical protein WAT25_01635 [Paracoccaceae bacterium]